jgi:hypothetical protein
LRFLGPVHWSGKFLVLLLAPALLASLERGRPSRQPNPQENQVDAEEYHKHVQLRQEMDEVLPVSVHTSSLIPALLSGSTVPYLFQTTQALVTISADPYRLGKMSEGRTDRAAEYEAV